eukprot:sb/3478562/
MEPDPILISLARTVVRVIGLTLFSFLLRELWSEPDPILISLARTVVRALVSQNEMHSSCAVVHFISIYALQCRAYMARLHCVQNVINTIHQLTDWLITR